MQQSPEKGPRKHYSSLPMANARARARPCVPVVWPCVATALAARLCYPAARSCFLPCIFRWFSASLDLQSSFNHPQNLPFDENPKIYPKIQAKPIVSKMRIVLPCGLRPWLPDCVALRHDHASFHASFVGSRLRQTSNLPSIHPQNLPFDENPKIYPKIQAKPIVSKMRTEGS